MAGRLDQLDLTLQIKDRDTYKQKLKQFQVDLLEQQLRLKEMHNRNAMVVFEGPDAAGKGGVIRRITERLDPRHLRVYSIIKPTPEEYAHHYLWRFWNKLPAFGQMAIFDRSWYGRVLVERVEKFCTKDEWKRAYREINEFERVLSDGGTIIVKFWLHISKDEQLRRFEARQADKTKHWKISEEDWRNRKKWDEHIQAAEEMFEKTDTPVAPWTLVEAEHKFYARLKVIQTLVDRLKTA